MTFKKFSNSLLAAMILMTAFVCLPQNEVKAQDGAERAPLPITTSPSIARKRKALEYRQAVAQYQQQQMISRMEWNKWIGYSPLRPQMNASYMSNGVQQYYLPSQGRFISAGYTARTWYW